MTRAVETVVLGAGISGLAYAHARGLGADLIVLEASARPGGLVHTLRGGNEGQVRCEVGPEALANASEPTLALLRELELELQELPAEAKKRYLVREGRLHAVPMAPLDLLKSPLLSAGGKARALTEKWRAPKRALDGSIADFVRHRLGHEVLESFVDPLVSGIHAGDPEQLSLRACFPEVARMVEEHGGLFAALAARRKSGGGKRPPGLMKPAGGMVELPRALARRLGAQLQLSGVARSLERRGERWVVDLETETCEAQRVVLALPAKAAESLLARACPPAACELATLRGESLVSVSTVFDRARVEHPLDGFGYLVPSREGQLQLGTLFSSSIDPGACPSSAVLLRTLLGGARHPEAVELSERELLERVDSEVGPLLGLRGSPEWFHVARYRETLPRYDLDHPRRVRAFEAAVAEAPGLCVLGNYLRGIGLPALIAAARALAGAHASAGARA